jgi:hypothetical protein
MNWEVTLEEDKDTGDCILPFPAEMIAELGWLPDDILNLELQPDDSILITNITAEERKK